ncbi:hypothetical protein DIPPA_08877 [Diplonema papillatum]|nr:hypothetical protein DIPPA_08877 [Diplonema papillatum]
MVLSVREPTEDEKVQICEHVKDGAVKLNDKEYRIDYSVSLESRVTTEKSHKKRVEKVTTSSGADVIYFEVTQEAEEDAGKSAQLPPALTKEPVQRKQCVFFNKGTCRTGNACEFGHLYQKPRPFKKA